MFLTESQWRTDSVLFLFFFSFFFCQYGPPELCFPPCKYGTLRNFLGARNWRMSNSNSACPCLTSLFICNRHLHVVFKAALFDIFFRARRRDGRTPCSSWQTRSPDRLAAYQAVTANKRWSALTFSSFTTPSEACLWPPDERWSNIYFSSFSLDL